MHCKCIVNCEVKVLNKNHVSARAAIDCVISNKTRRPLLLWLGLRYRRWGARGLIIRFSHDLKHAAGILDSKSLAQPPKWFSSYKKEQIIDSVVKFTHEFGNLQAVFEQDTACGRATLLKREDLSNLCLEPEMTQHKEFVFFFRIDSSNCLEWTWSMGALPAGMRDDEGPTGLNGWFHPFHPCSCPSSKASKSSEMMSQRERSKPPKRPESLQVDNIRECDNGIPVQ